MWRRLCLATVAAGLGIAAVCVCGVPHAGATVQDEDICWDPDIEFPTACDDDED